MTQWFARSRRTHSTQASLIRPARVSFPTLPSVLQTATQRQPRACGVSRRPQLQHIPRIPMRGGECVAVLRMAAVGVSCGCCEVRMLMRVCVPFRFAALGLVRQGSEKWERQSRAPSFGRAVRESRNPYSIHRNRAVRARSEAKGRSCLESRCVRANVSPRCGWGRCIAHRLGSARAFGARSCSERVMRFTGCSSQTRSQSQKQISRCHPRGWSATRHRAPSAAPPARGRSNPPAAASQTARSCSPH